MASLPEETLNTIFKLQKQLFYVTNKATATEYDLLEQYGETSETLSELEELFSIRERARDAYTRLFRLLLNIAPTQPIAN